MTRVRHLILQVHLWLGLTVGLLLALAGVTGTVLMYDEEIDAALNPELLRSAPADVRVPFQQVYAAVATSYPDDPISYVRMPRAAHETYEFTTAGAEPLEIFADPYTGAVLGARGVTEGFTNALWHLHVYLLSGENGERVMGVVGVLALLIVLTGLIVWLPRAARWWRGLIVRWPSNWKRVNFDLHRAGGIWSAAFLAVTAFTGAALIFHDAFLAAANGITRSSPVAAPPAVTAQPEAAWLPLDTLLANAHRALPGGTITYVTFPSTPDAPLSARLHFAEALHPNGRSFVHLDPWTGAPVAVESALRAPAGTRALNLLYPLHIGSFGGFAVRLLYALFGLTPLALLVTGTLMWWNRTQAPKRRRRLRARERVIPTLPSAFHPAETARSSDG